MKVVMISTDRKAFEEGSEVRRRFELYGSLVEELHIIVFAKKKLGFEKEQITQNTFLYPTNSSNVLRYMSDAQKIGKAIKDVDLVTTQDPFETGIVGELPTNIIQVEEGIRGQFPTSPATVPLLSIMVVAFLAFILIFREKRKRARS